MAKIEVSVLSGEEGRFLEWSDSSRSWVPFNYYNYRHEFEESTLGKADYAALRERYGLHEVGLPDNQLAAMSPDELESYKKAKG